MRRFRCPICKKKVAWENNPFKPFCSDRCRMIDLGKWASGAYRIETPEKKTDSLEVNPNGKK